MPSPPEKPKDDVSAERRRVCMMISYALVTLAIIVLLILIFTRLGNPMRATKGRKMMGGCGCMAMNN